MKKLLIGIFVVSILVGTTGCGCSKKKTEKPPVEEKGPHANTNEGVIKDQQVGNLKMTNTALVIDDGKSQLTTLVSNDTDEDIYVEMFDIHVKDSEGNLITTLKGFVGNVVPAHDSRNIISNCTIDLSHAATIEYSISE